MLDNIKDKILLKSVDKFIADGNFEIAFEKLNLLIQHEYKLSEVFLKRGVLCKKLYMYEEAYSDFTYIINHCAEKNRAYLERFFLNFEMGNYFGTLADAEHLLQIYQNNFEINRLKVLSYIFLQQEKKSIDFLNLLFDENKYKILHFLFDETAKILVKDEFSKALKILKTIDLIDRNNPIKLLKEANIYSICHDTVMEQMLIEKINKNFPQYFVSHFEYKDMYDDIDILKINFLLELAIFDTAKLFNYPFKILEGYKKYYNGQITDAKETFEAAILINPTKPEGYVLLAQILQLMSGYDKHDYIQQAEQNYKMAMNIYQKEGQIYKVEDMKKEIMHINANLNF